MKKIYLFFLLFIVHQSFAQADFDLVKIFNINGNVYTHEKIWLKDNTYLVPISFNTATYTLEPGVIVTNPNYQQGNFRILLAHYDDEAQLIDHFMLNSTGYEQLFDITVDDKDNIYLTYGVQQGYILDGQTYFANTDALTSKVMMLKLSKGRVVAWKKTFEGGDLMMFSLAIAKNEDVYVAARASQQNIKVDGINYSNPTAHPTQKQLTRMVIGKLNVNGNGMQWFHSSTNPVNETYPSIFVFNNHTPALRLDSQDNVYMVGTMMGTKATFGTTTLQNAVAQRSKFYMVKYSSAGQFMWAKSPTIPNSASSMEFVQFQIDSNDNLFLMDEYMSGNFSSSTTVDYWGQSYTTSYATNERTNSLIKLNTNGVVSWIKKPTQIPSFNSDTYSRFLYFTLVKDKILAFGYFLGHYNFGNGIEIVADQTPKWFSFEFNSNGDVDHHYVLESSLKTFPYNLIGMDNQNRLWFCEKTYWTGGFTNMYIGSLNYNVTTSGSNQKLLIFRSAAVTLGNEVFENTDLTLYPNPTHDFLHLSGKDLSQQNYQIYDLSGKLIGYGRIDDNRICVESLQTGMYVLKIFDRNDSRTKNTFTFKKQ